MSTGLDLSPVPLSERTASVLDVALLFAGANIVTTTLVTGGALGTSHPWREVLLTVGVGILVGTLPIALLARLGPRYGLPSMVLLRSVFGTLGAAGVSLILVLTNFAWIALNNVIAASALEGLVGGRAIGWSLLVGLLAIAVAALGPRSMALFDRVAVPLMALIGALLTLRLLQVDRGTATLGFDTGAGFFSGLDLIVGYQVSWSLMFADYTRFQSRERSASLSVLLGLCLTSSWLMLVGARSAQLGGGSDPTDMILGLGLPAIALIIVALSTITTNFVNLFISGLALRNLWPGAPERGTILAVGAIGTALGLASPGLLDSYAGYMGLLGTLFLPLVAITLVHFSGRQAPSFEHTLDPPALRFSAIVAWALGVITYQTVSRVWPEVGATIPTLVVSALAYRLSVPIAWPGSRSIR